MAESRTDEQIKEDIIDELVNKMYNENNGGVKNFLENIFKGKGSLTELKDLIIQFDKGQKVLQNFKQQFYNSIDDLKITGENKYHRDTIQQILDDQKQKLTEENFKQKYLILSNNLKQYNKQIEEQNNCLQQILSYMILFQTQVTELLNIKMSFLLTTQTEAKIMTYNEKDGENIASILKISSDQKVKIIDQALQDISVIITQQENMTQSINPLVQLIEQEINKMKQNDERSKILTAIRNEENTYNEILNRYNISKGHEIYWQIGTYNQRHIITNKGPIEEARQGFLLRIHLEDIYNLFQNDSKPEGPITGRSKGQKKKDPLDSIQAQKETMIHNFIRSKYGVINVDNQSGLIIDDHLIAVDNLLDGVKKILTKGDKKIDFVSIASKTSNANFTSYNKFFNLITDLTKDPKISKQDLKEYITKNFFTGSSITKIIGKVKENALKEIEKDYKK